MSQSINHFPDVLCEWTTDGVPLKYLSDSLKVLIPTGNLITHPGGVSLQKRNGSGTVDVCLRLYADQFDSFYCKSTTMIGISWEILNSKVLKSMSGKNTNITYFVRDTEQEVQEEFCVLKRNDRGIQKLYTLHPVDEENEDSVITDKYEYMCIIGTSFFREIIEEITTMAGGKQKSGSTDPPRIRITGLQDSMKFSVGGIDGDLQVLIRPTEDNVVIECDPDDHRVYESEYPIEILSTICNSANVKMTDKIKIYLPTKGPEFPPLLIQMNVGLIGEVKYYVSEKVDSEDIICIDDGDDVRFG